MLLRVLQSRLTDCRFTVGRKVLYARFVLFWTQGINGLSVVSPIHQTGSISQNGKRGVARFLNASQWLVCPEMRVSLSFHLMLRIPQVLPYCVPPFIFRHGVRSTYAQTQENRAKYLFRTLHTVSVSCAI